MSYSGLKMKLLLLKLKAWNLKRKARNLYYIIEKEADLGCGIGLAEYIRPQLVTKRQEFEVLVSQAKAVDFQIEDQSE